MKLQFDKSGRRFFFLTFCVRKRKAMLSKIVAVVGKDGKRGYTTELTATGEVIAARWRGIHATNAALTASNFIMMPDHVHLLLIVDYRQAPFFDILDWFKHFMRACEDAVSPIVGVRPELVWEEKFWLLLVNAGKPLANVRKYIKLNRRSDAGCFAFSLPGSANEEEDGRGASARDLDDGREGAAWHAPCLWPSFAGREGIGAASSRGAVCAVD